MNIRKKPKLSFFAAVYIWILAYIGRSKFLSRRWYPEGEASVILAFLQACNYMVIWRSIIIIFNLDISYSIWIDGGVFICLSIFNSFMYERKIDNLIERHNALTVKQRMRNKLKMWIYVIFSILSMIGLLIYISNSRDDQVIEKPRHINEIRTSGKHQVDSIAK
jgi:hypothetical protein